MKKVNLEENSEEVKIGKILHENKNNSENSEVQIDNIVILWHIVYLNLSSFVIENVKSAVIL